MVIIKEITSANKQDIIFHNDPFQLWGTLIPSYQGQKWDYCIQEWPEEEKQEMCFPDENYDYDTMCSDSIFLGAYEDGICIGLLVLQKAFFKYMYVADLEVTISHRRQGVGKLLITAALEVAKARGYHGLYLQVQDNNLSACLFYLNTGFRIGGFDTEVYKGTNQEGKSDITLYLDA